MVTTTPLSGQPSTLLRSSRIMAVNSSAVRVSLLGFKSSICFQHPCNRTIATQQRGGAGKAGTGSRANVQRDVDAHIAARAECFNQQPQNTELRIQFDRRKAVASFEQLPAGRAWKAGE